MFQKALKYVLTKKVENYIGWINVKVQTLIYFKMGLINGFQIYFMPQTVKACFFNDKPKLTSWDRQLHYGTDR